MKGAVSAKLLWALGETALEREAGMRVHNPPLTARRAVATMLPLLLLAVSCSKSTSTATPSNTAAGHPILHGYYDGHIDDYLNLDVSDESQALKLNINYAVALGNLPSPVVQSLPEIYMFDGPAASGQNAIFGSEPGEASYTPMLRETMLTWKSGATPTLLTSDTQINAEENTGRLTEKSTRIVLNCPILTVGGTSS
jgi:hypothetical protein